MGFKRSNMRIMIDEFIKTNPQCRKYFYCEHCEGKMKFIEVANKHILQCSKCGKEVEE